MKLKQLFQKLFTPLENCEAVTLQLCKLLNIKVTRTNLQKQFEAHPDYPSLLAVSDVLKNCGIENISFKTTAAQLQEFFFPMLVQVNINNEKYFTVISELNDMTVNYIHPVSGEKVQNSFNEFSSLFTGFVLLAEATNNSGERDFSTHLKEEKRILLTKILTAVIIPVFVLVACLLTLIHSGTASIAAVTYTLLTFSGTLVGTLLLWYEVDKYNPALQQICSGGKKTNCNAILSSDASKIFGISWSAIGFTYFAGSLISLLVSGIYNLPVLFILSWLNVFALPYIAFSIYYQARIAKQWCPMCLAVQAVLAVQFIAAFFGGFHTAIDIASVQFSTLLAISFSFVIPFLVVSLLLPALRKAKESKQNKNELQRLKHNPQIFDALLAKQKAITEPTDGLGIFIGNPDAKYKLLKVCNPYCGPCAKAHPTIEELLENNPDVQVQIIFTSDAEPTKHLLAIAEKENEIQTKQALDDWYLADKKDYEVFAAKYPNIPPLEGQREALKAMAEWCSKTEIAFTPTFFVNGYQLPEIYTVADLKYFLSV
ncbi:MAG: vitamin K epoxide reductase family protein [Arachidicoccus sp.]|nr:vitamin K epoxide reductase family protein [Arachidicoccus sp.]